MSESDVLEQMIVMLHNINMKVDQLLPIYNNVDGKSVTDTMDIMTLLSLPDKLRKTASALIELGSASASDVAKITHRERAIESNYLNQLNRMGHIKKCREGRNVYFSINEMPD